MKPKLLHQQAETAAVIAFVILCVGLMGSLWAAFNATGLEALIILAIGAGVAAFLYLISQLLHIRAALEKESGIEQAYSAERWQKAVARENDSTNSV